MPGSRCARHYLFCTFYLGQQYQLHFYFIFSWFVIVMQQGLIELFIGWYCYTMEKYNWMALECSSVEFKKYCCAITWCKKITRETYRKNFENLSRRNIEGYHPYDASSLTAWNFSPFSQVRSLGHQFFKKNSSIWLIRYLHHVMSRFCLQLTNNNIVLNLEQLLLFSWCSL